MRCLPVALILGLGACADRGSGPAPKQHVNPQAKTHTLELSYWLASYGDASQLPAAAPLITVVLRPVLPNANGWADWQPAQPVLRVQDVSTTVHRVRLPDVTTYAVGSRPLLNATVTVPVAPNFGAGLGYYVRGQYTIDGVVDTTRALSYTPQDPNGWDFSLVNSVVYVLRH